MPLYEYQCESCGERFEVIQKFSDPPPDVCTKCGKGPVVRQLSSPAIQFKGTGWYITDYAKNKGAKAGSSETKDAKETPGGTKAGGESSSSTDSARTETKTDTKTETKSS